jgi:ComF family protein
MGMLAHMQQGLLHLFYPRLCAGCRAALTRAEQVLCLGCMQKLPRTSYHHIPDNETALRLAGRFPFQFATSYAWFTAHGLLQQLLHGLKYHDQKETGYFLGRQLGSELSVISWSRDLDAIIPVPLHPRKQALRGYNQSELIAAGLAESLHIPMHAHILRRMRHTESQTQKSREDRALNMKAAFGLQHSRLLEGRHVLLIDDVLTTGATLEACARTLLQLPGLKLSLATIGIASD